MRPARIGKLAAYGIAFALGAALLAGSFMPARVEIAAAAPRTRVPAAP